MGWNRLDGRFSKRQIRRILHMVHEGGRTPREVAKIAGCSTRYVYVLLKKHEEGFDEQESEVGGSEPEIDSDVPEKNPTANSLQHVERENSYLRWVAKGAINGWVDRLIQDIKDGKLT